MWLIALILGFVTLQRLAELAISRRNTARLFARGGIETGAAHYPLIVAFHALWLGGLWLLAWERAVDWPWLTAFLVLQAARGWVIASLGERWTTRIVTVPGERLVEAGPYRYLRHPNYVVVAAEVFTLPMAFGLLWYALLASLLNAGLLWVRIRSENQALGSLQSPGRGPS